MFCLGQYFGFRLGFSVLNLTIYSKKVKGQSATGVISQYA